MALSPDTFAYVADHVRRRSAIQLEAGKEYLVESRLLPLSRVAGAASVDDYIRAVRQSAREADLEAIVEALTTNETSWFRDNSPFQALRHQVLPTLFPSQSGRLNLWSAACSTGQEPYSIAMTVADQMPNVRLQITATDLSEQVLARARTGLYSQLEVNRGLPAQMMVQHFTRAGTEWQVADAIRRTVTFQRHNLLDAPPAGGPYDVVFLRNVLIYFDMATKRAILQRVLRVLRPGGFLILGAAETTVGVDGDWERVPVGQGSVYRPAGSGPVVSTPGQERPAHPGIDRTPVGPRPLSSVGAAHSVPAQRTLPAQPGSGAFAPAARAGALPPAARLTRAEPPAARSTIGVPPAARLSFSVPPRQGAQR